MGILEPLTITANDGTIGTVVATGPGGEALAGTLSSDRTRWVSASLQWGGDYTAAVQGTGSDGRPAATLNAAFRTVTPARMWG